MDTNYVIRFDDICPTMRWDIWDKIEATLHQYSLRPLVAVVPENHDPVLKREEPKQDFWFRVRAWRDKGWSIGLHGYQHLYVTREKGFYGRAANSEFAGLSADEQETKLRKAIAIFHSEDIAPAAWVAPGHSFDYGTLAGLKKIGLKVISDGFFLGPRTDSEGFIWVPQQLGKFRAMPFGFWTICLHHNSWTAKDFAAFEAFLDSHHREIVGLDKILERLWPRFSQIEDRLFTGTANCLRRMRPTRTRKRIQLA